MNERTASAPVAVLSDVHGNLEALSAVLADADAAGCGGILSLGDAVGYGPEPEACVRLLRGRGARCVTGNHELALVEPGLAGWFNPLARRALEVTRGLLSADSLAWFRTLPRAGVFFGARCVHGCPPADALRYLYELDGADLRRTFGEYAEAVCFVGHTHELALVTLGAGGRISFRGPGRGRRALDPAVRYIVNVGSVGQPRDGDNRAKYVLWTPGAESPGTMEVRRVPYDIARTAAGIVERGLPRIYADRLR